MQRSLTGANESARVACIRFLSDLELYRKDDGECPRCAANAAEPIRVKNVVSQEKARAILEGREAIGLVAPRAKIEEMAEEVAQERLAALKPEHGIPA